MCGHRAVIGFGGSSRDVHPVVQNAVSYAGRPVVGLAQPAPGEQTSGQVTAQRAALRNHFPFTAGTRWSAQSLRPNHHKSLEQA
jgi:hypothetical protein